LAENTLRRIAKGIEKFVINNPNPFIVQVNHGGNNFRGQQINTPLATITAKHGYGVVAPTLIQYHGEQSGSEVRGQSLQKPLMVVDSSPRYALVSSFLTKFYGTNIGSKLTEPVPTITATGQHIGEVRAFLLKYYGTDIGQAVNDPLHTVTTKDRFGLVTIHGQDYQIADIGMRMLEPRELFNAQGFPADYIIDKDCNGKKYSKSAQVARCGNAVPPQLAEALVRANLPEICEAEAAG
jgi:DNA (cytosine-5)-methyltransferase 1